jgi:apolipoprotein N-acyltransferase
LTLPKVSLLHEPDAIESWDSLSTADSRRSTRWRSLRRESLAALSGLLLFLSFPKFGHGAVAWVALVPLLVALPGTTIGMAFRLGYLTGAVSALGLLYWTAFVVIQYGGLSLPVGILIMGLLCLAVALFPALFAVLVSGWLRAFGGAALLLSPLAWVATELLRVHTFFEFPWCLLGYSQHDLLPFVQIASVTAVYGVSFLIVLASALLAFAGRETRPRPRRLALLALVVVVGGSWAFGAWRMSRPLPETGRIRVGLVQGGIRQEEKWVPEKAADNIDRHLDLTREAASGGARLVVWPESSVPFFFDDSPELAGELRDVVRRHGIYLLFGNDDREPGPDGRVFVGAKMLAPDGTLTFRYHKIHLVPFGEYVPLQPLLTLGGRYAAKLVRQVSDFTPGREYSVGEVDGHRLGASICYEAIFPGLFRELTARGADLLVNVTNDAWYGTTSAPHQHLEMATLRAVESGKYLVRAANTGITAVVDPHGRVLQQTGLFDRTVLVRDVPIVPGRTFYSRHGDVFAWACFAAAGLAAVVARTSRAMKNVQASTGE